MEILLLKWELYHLKTPRITPLSRAYPVDG
jgi:hypothetical protein